MSLRSNLALLAVALILGAGVWWFEFRGAEQRAAADAAAARMLGIEAESVRALELPLADGGRARLTRDPAGAWRLEAPIEFPADDAAAGAIVKALADLVADAVIEAPPEDLAPFGLDETRQSVRIFLDGPDAMELWLGSGTPFGNARYAAIESDLSRIYTVERARTGPLAPELGSLRERSLAEFDPAGVSRVAISSPDGLVFRAARADSGAKPEWLLVEPHEGAADGRRIRRLLRDLASARATAFVDDPDAARDYGLAPAERRIELETGAGGTVVLELGREDGELFARSSERPALLRVDGRFFRDVPGELFAYRDKQVLEIEDGRVHRIELEFPRDARRYRFVRDENRWTPEQALARSVESLRVDDVVYALRDLEATSLEPPSASGRLPELGLDPPLVRVRLEAADGQELGWLELAGPEPSAGIAARSSQSERIWRVRNDLGEDVPMGLAAFEDRFLRESAASPVSPAGESLSVP